MAILLIAKYITSFCFAHSSKKVNISICEGIGNDVCHIGKQKRFTTEAERAQREMAV